MMFKRIATFAVVAVFALSLAGCRRDEVNTNTDNTNVAENAFANITDANEALAEGNRLLDEDQVETAVEAFKQAVKLNPDVAEAWFKMGIAYGLLEKAAERSGDQVVGESDSKVKPNSQKAFEKAVEAYNAFPHPSAVSVGSPVWIPIRTRSANSSGQACPASALCAATAPASASCARAKA